jgi:hypothetical protein
VERATFRGVLGQVLHCVGEPQCNERIGFGHDAQRSGAGPSSDTGENGHILPPVGSAVRHGLPDDP